MSKDKEKVIAVLTQDKVCKSCVRFVGDAENGVTTSLYLLNDAFQKLGEPTEITVSVSAK